MYLEPFTGRRFQYITLSWRRHRRPRDRLCRCRFEPLAPLVVRRSFPDFLYRCAPGLPEDLFESGKWELTQDSPRRYALGYTGVNLCSTCNVSDLVPLQPARKILNTQRYYHLYKRRGT